MSYITRKLKRIGMALIEGPRSVLPPCEDGTYFDWFEPQLRIFCKSFDARHWSSVIVFVDNTMNRLSDFRTPISRFAKWSLCSDIDSGKTWPSIVPIYRGLESAQPEIDEHVADLGKLLRCVPFSCDKLYWQRDHADIAWTHELDSFRVFVSNGFQTVEFYTPFLLQDDYTSRVRNIFESIASIGEAMVTESWIERYNGDPTQDNAEQAWDWTLSY